MQHSPSHKCFSLVTLAVPFLCVIADILQKHFLCLVINGKEKILKRYSSQKYRKKVKEWEKGRQVKEK